MGSAVSGVRRGLICAKLGILGGRASLLIPPGHRQCLGCLWDGKSKELQCSSGCRRIWLMFSLFSPLFSSGKAELQGDEHFKQH